MASIAALACRAADFSAEQKKLSPDLERRVKQFVAQKESQAHTLAKRESGEQSPQVWEFFQAGEKGDWATFKTLYEGLRTGAYQYSGGKKDKRLETMVWQTVNESWGAYEECYYGEERYVRQFSEDIIKSIPPGSVYFGGTDPGRWLVTLFEKSHEKADPFFVLTQNALADGLYMEYLRAMYGKRIAIPSESDVSAAFDGYVADAKKRLHEDKLKPGENVWEKDGKTEVSGQMAVMAINGLIAKKIFDANRAQEFYIQESFALDWMMPYLAPHGPILRINRTPMAEMPDSDLKKDAEYWSRFTSQAVGPWLNKDASIQVLCDYAAKTSLRRDYSGFKGDLKYVHNNNACRTFSKLRSSIAGMYAWRAKNAESAGEREKMGKEADFAFRQAIALCPSSREAELGELALLISLDRKEEALLLAKMAEKVDSGTADYTSIIWDLEQDLDPKK